MSRTSFSASLPATSSVTAAMSSSIEKWTGPARESRHSKPRSTSARLSLRAASLLTAGLRACPTRSLSHAGAVGLSTGKAGAGGAGGVPPQGTRTRARAGECGGDERRTDELVDRLALLAPLVSLGPFALGGGSRSLRLEPGHITSIALDLFSACMKGCRRTQAVEQQSNAAPGWCLRRIGSGVGVRASHQRCCGPARLGQGARLGGCAAGGHLPHPPTWTGWPERSARR